MPPRRYLDADQVIALNAQGFTQHEIAKQVGANQASICELLQRHGVASFWKPGGFRKYDLNEEYFTVIDTPEKAYWLGFLAADGHITVHNGSPDGVAVHLAIADVDHLRALAAALGSDAEPKIEKGKAARITFHSQRLVADLISHGITPRKTWTCSPWDGPAGLMPHYWRGLIDGDGHIREGRAVKEKMIVFVGTQAMVEGFRSFAAAICGTKTVPRERVGCWGVSIQGRRQVHALLTAMYREDWVALARKKEVALAITAEPYTPLRFKKTCTVCGDTAIARRLCGKHYQRWRNNGDPLALRLVRGPDGRFQAA